MARVKARKERREQEDVLRELRDRYGLGEVIGRDEPIPAEASQGGTATWGK